MKKIMLAVASVAMAGSLAVCAQEPDDAVVTESQRDTDQSMEERQQDPTVASDYDRERTSTGPADTRVSQHDQASEQSDGMGMGMGMDVSTMTAAELKGKKVLTLTGEEIGEIDEVGISGTRQERVATVEVGGFLGISEKTIAIPLSELQSSVSGEDSVKTSLTRTSIETLPEFDESDFSADDEDDDDDEGF